MKHFILILYLLLTGCNYLKTPVPDSIDPPSIEVCQDLNKDNLADMIYKLPFQHKDIIYKIIILESAHLKSIRSIRDNNISGMSCVKKRTNLQLDCTERGHGIYADWRDCVYDLLLWEQNVTKNKKLTKEGYYKMINRVYNKNASYIQTLKQIKGYDFA